MSHIVSETMTVSTEVLYCSFNKIGLVGSPSQQLLLLCATHAMHEDALLLVVINIQYDVLVLYTIHISSLRIPDRQIRSCKIQPLNLILIF